MTCPPFLKSNEPGFCTPKTGAPEPMSKSGKRRTFSLCFQVHENAELKPVFLTLKPAKRAWS